MGARKGTALRVALAATAVGAFAAAGVVAVRSGLVPVGSWGSEQAPAPELAGVRSVTAGDGYGGRGDLFVVAEGNRLFRYAKLGAGRQRLSVAVTGLAGGERIVGIDTRPANGQLYAVGSTSRLYVLDPATGAATPVGPVFGTALSGDRFGVDFNPVVDRLRIVSDTGQNMRIDPTTGAVAGVDTALTRGGVSAAAYTNSVAGARSTELYDIDSTTDTLLVQGTRVGVMPVVSPNTGQLFEVGRLGVDVTGLDGFDIGPQATAVAAVQVAGSADTRLAGVDLGTGRVTLRGKLPRGVAGIAVSAGAPVTVYAVTARNDLVRFERDGLGIRAQLPLTGLAPGERVVGIDVRPADGQLYLLGSTNQVYTVEPASAAATAVGAPFSSDTYGDGVGFDVNPAADRLRVVTSSGQNLRLVPETAALAGMDKPLAYVPGDRNAATRPRATHVAYTNSRAGATSTTLYDIDTGADTLAVQNPPNDGMLRTTGKLRVNVGAAGGFDIAADGTAIAAFARSGGTRIYTVDLTTGAAEQVGRVGRGSLLVALAVAPRGV